MATHAIHRSTKQPTGRQPGLLLVALVTLASVACEYEVLDLPSAPDDNGPIVCPAIPAPPACEGTLTSPDVGPDGCPLALVCVCEDGTPTPNGKCECSCAPCMQGDSYPVLDSTCCGFSCAACEPPAAAPFTTCAGTIETLTDAHGCQTGTVCRCSDGAISATGACDAPCGTCETCVPGSTFQQPSASCCGYECAACPAVAAPMFASCEGIVEAVLDANDCVIGYQCVCPDYSVSTSGLCAVSCAEVTCVPCPTGMTLLLDGSCCGICQDECSVCTYDCPKGAECTTTACNWMC